MLTADGCRARQSRLVAAMQTNEWDLFLTANYRTVYWLSGVLGPAEVPCAAGLDQTGRCFVISGGKRDSHAADELIPLETYTIHRCLSDLAGDAANLIERYLGARRVDRCGVELGTYPSRFPIPSEEIADATPAVLRARKRKEPDEVDEIRESLRLCATAYDTARDVIRPGITEIDVHNAMFDAVTRRHGTTVVFAGDFACGERCVSAGGPPTNRVIEEGDLYILDLFPSPALYFGDVCRAYPASAPTALQQRAFDLVAATLREAEKLVRPGVRARDVHQFVKNRLDDSFWHHAGHGIGHHGHEAPRIIPGSDEVFEVGDVFTLEPGVYSKELRGGIRLEDNYLVTTDGIENLFGYPLDWTR